MNFQLNLNGLSTIVYLLLCVGNLLPYIGCIHVFTSDFLQVLYNLQLVLDLC